jgi:hypothetical protein
VASRAWAGASGPGDHEPVSGESMALLKGVVHAGFALIKCYMHRVERFADRIGTRVKCVVQTVTRRGWSKHQGTEVQVHILVEKLHGAYSMYLVADGQLKEETRLHALTWTNVSMLAFVHRGLCSSPYSTLIRYDFIAHTKIRERF